MSTEERCGRCHAGLATVRVSRLLVLCSRCALLAARGHRRWP